MGTSLDEVMEIADSHANSGNDAEAIQAYMEALEIDPENATAWYCLGVLYSRTNSLDKAVESFQKSNKIFCLNPFLRMILIKTKHSLKKNTFLFVVFC